MLKFMKIYWLLPFVLVAALAASGCKKELRFNERAKNSKDRQIFHNKKNIKKNFKKIWKFP